tara:strand:- start:1074 stop:1292 length:219 start_codon:yes stop_codon:yes gene_type:complete
MAPKTYDYYYNQQYYKVVRGKIFVWRVDDWVASTVEIYELVGSKSQEQVNKKRRDQKNKRQQKEKERGFFFD